MYTSVDFTRQIDWAKGVSYTNLVSGLVVTLKIDYPFITLVSITIFVI
jgi:hypothetical protein